MVALESGIGGGESAFAGGVLDASDGWNHFGQARNLVALVPRLSAPDVPTTAPVGSLTAAGLEEAGPAMARAPTPGHTARTVAVGICTACYRMAHLDFLGRATSTGRDAAEDSSHPSLDYVRPWCDDRPKTSTKVKIVKSSDAARRVGGAMLPSKMYSAAMGAFPQTPVLILAVLSAGLAQMIAGAVVMNVLKFIPFGRNAMVELNTSKTFRKFDSFGMAYVMGFAPFVSSFMFVCAYWILDCKPPVTPLLAAQVFWVIGAAHGIIIDHASIKYSVEVAAYFLTSTFINAAVMGWVVEYIYKKHHWAF
jgi:hypothetical protein